MSNAATKTLSGIIILMLLTLALGVWTRFELFTFVSVWFWFELTAFFVGHPGHADTGEPARPPISIGDMMWYNPGYLKTEEK